MWLRRRRLLLFLLEEDKRRIVKRLLALRLHFHLLSRVLILQSLQRHCLTPPSPVLLCSTPRPATPSAPENLDISFFNILPSHVYLRKITDVDMVTSDPSLDPSRTAVGTLPRQHPSDATYPERRLVLVPLQNRHGYHPQ